MNKILLAMLLALVAGCNAPEQPQRDGTIVALDKNAYEGRWVVVNYWAKWCKPCIKEIPELNALDSKYKQVAVLGVNYDGASGDELQTQITTLGIDFPILLQDPSASLGLALPSVLPTTLILNPDGQLVATLVGPQSLESLALATGQMGMPDAGPSSEELLERGSPDRSP
ncbi:MAG: TlpA disulfide reductase family protein [Halioglobus sp.]